MSPVYKLSDARSILGPNTYYTSMLAGNTAFVAGSNTYEWLETATVGSGGQATIEFTNLNTNYEPNYQHLQLRITMRSTRNDTDSLAYLQFNGVTSASYRSHYLRGTGSAAQSADPTAGYPNGILLYSGLPGATNTSNLFGGSIVDILDPFETSKNTTVRTLCGQAGSFNRVALESGVWLNTAAVTSIKLDDIFGNFAQYTRVSLYGMRRA